MSVTDTIPPTITYCPQDMTFTVTSQSRTISIGWLEPTATDDSGTPPSVTQSYQSGDLFGVGSTTVEYVFRDQAGNMATCTFDIVVIGKL